MGRKRKGHIRERDGRFEVEVAGEYVGTYDDPDKAERMRRGALVTSEGSAAETFGGYGTEWMDNRELSARRRSRHRPFAKERSRWNAHVVDSVLWKLPWRKLSPQMLQTYVDGLLVKKAMRCTRRKRAGQWFVDRTEMDRAISRKVVDGALSLVKLCLDRAVVAGKFSWCNNQNPARLVILPPVPVPELEGELVVHATEEEIAALFALDLPVFQRAVFAIAIYAGLRLDEIWGLRWQDVILTGRKPALRVRRSYDGPVKTRNALRDVPLLRPAFDAVRAWRASLQTVPVTGLVFPAEGGGCHGESYVAGWRDKLDRGRSSEPQEGWATRAGIRPEISFLFLRHTCGCHLVQGTWTPRPLTLHEVKRWMGHSSITVTEKHYASLTADNLHNAVAEPGFTGYKPDALSDYAR